MKKCSLLSFHSAEPNEKGIDGRLSYYLIVDFAANKKQIEQNFLDFQLLAAEKETLLLQQNAELQAALLQGQTIERKRVAADLHDSLGSTISYP